MIALGILIVEYFFNFYQDYITEIINLLLRVRTKTRVASSVDNLMSCVHVE